jgi:Na+-transporting NADH:ubiquinone oxidoreductase subunit A
LKQIVLKKGHNIRITGIPSSDSLTLVTSKKIGVSPNSFRNVKPKLMVSEGDTVKIGTPLFYDKTKPKVKWASPASGNVSKIIYGSRRVIERIEIEVDGEEKIINDLKTVQNLDTASRNDILKFLLDANLFHLIRERPFNRVPSPDKEPRDIFISGLNTGPIAINLTKTITENKVTFQKALTAISKLTTGKTYFTSSQNHNFKNIENQIISGPHPAGNVGIQIHHTKPLKPNDTIWTIDAQHLLTIGRLFETGSYNPSMVVSVGGSGALAPFTAEVNTGVQIKNLIDNQNLNKQKIRLVSGDVLTGESTSQNDFLGFYDSTLSIINDTVERPFLGMLSIGNSSTKYSLARVFLRLTDKLFNFTTAQNGELRPMVPISAWEKVLPMDIFPNELYRAILAEDIEEMEKLGIWECDDEDFALCSFSCPSKIDVGKVIRDGLNLIEAEA